MEKSLPICYRKSKEIITINSLLDLNIFSGISNFDAIVSEKLEIENNTKEFYIGGRKAVYAQPFYIGKLLNITFNDNSLLDNVKEYSFSKIYMKDIEPGIKVNVSHLRIPPHYQMGGMVYINRVRQYIEQNKNNYAPLRQI